MGKVSETAFNVHAYELMGWRKEPVDYDGWIARLR